MQENEKKKQNKIWKQMKIKWIWYRIKKLRYKASYFIDVTAYIIMLFCSANFSGPGFPWNVWAMHAQGIGKKHKHKPDSKIEDLELVALR